ncbi:MAG: hypothetical protein EDR02_13095 [Actinobacteria bacterium]|nr:MAG: hypothetical protein EDR02_13095 [Actinomycetota bacterium]RIK04572.1 MAG: hypothetical protein DCC48_12730 [Acidobacteriota bacterium]
MVGSASEPAEVHLDRCAAPSNSLHGRGLKCTMSSGDRERTVLHERLDRALGNDAADTLMGYLPPVGWADVATKSDLALLRSELQVDLSRIDGRLSHLEARLQELDTRTAELETRLDTRSAELEARLDTRFADLETRLGTRSAELEARLEAKFERTLRQAVLALVMVMIAAVGAAVSITQMLAG